MKSRIKTLIISLITIIVVLLAYVQVFPIIIHNPNSNFTPIEMSEAKHTQDNNMTLSYLYNITKEKHPTGSEEIYEVRDYIISCLKEMNVVYDTQTINLDENFFQKYVEDIYEEMLELKDDCLEDLKAHIR